MPKFDGVIEAVRYKGGKIELVRAYERRGATFSDWVVLDRAALLERLKQGRRFLTGQRRELWASTFKLGKPVSIFGQDSSQVVSTSGQGQQDELEGVPLF